jgi:pyruvate formate lyase activating enzyme
MGKKYSVHQLTEILLADKEYYEKSGGGVTFSGGEPMLQFEFIETVINDIDGIHVALDTSGYCASSTFIDILKKIDLLLFDIKHMDSKQHKQLTGVGNKLILENFEIAIKSGVSLKVRYPMVAGVNDGDENILSMSKLLKKFKIDSLDVCVYHNYGISKYYDLGLEPMMFKDYTETQKKERIEFIRKCGINPVIV